MDLTVVVLAVQLSAVLNSSDSIVTKFCPRTARLHVVCVSQLPKVLMEKLSKLTVIGLGGLVMEALDCMQVQLQFSVAVT